MVDGAGYTLRSPSTLITLETSPTRMRYHHIAGTVAGYTPPDYAQFGMWDLANEMSNTEYSEVYLYDEISLVGVGGTYETPAGPGFKFLGYTGVANNNQNGSGYGPVQLYTIARPTNADASSPLQASEFAWDCYTQSIGTGRALQQNLNTGTHLVVGQVHVLEQVLRLNDIGFANGEWHWWIDGVKVGEYTDLEFINASFAAVGGDGLAGFFGTKRDLVWGGSGGANKTRDDVTDFHKSYFSGVFLRSAA